MRRNNGRRRREESKTWPRESVPLSSLPLPGAAREIGASLVWSDKAMLHIPLLVHSGLLPQHHIQQ